MLPIPPSTTGELETLSIPMSYRLTHTHTHRYKSMHMCERTLITKGTQTPKLMHMLRCMLSVLARYINNVMFMIIICMRII